MRMFWSTLLVLAFTRVYSLFDDSSETPARMTIRENRYQVYKAINETLIDIEFTGVRSKNYTDFIADLRRINSSEPRFGVIYYEYFENESPKNKIISILWAPEGPQSVAFQDHFAKSIGKDEIAAQLGIDGILIATKKEDLTEETLLLRIRIIPVTITPQFGEETSRLAIAV